MLTVVRRDVGNDYITPSTGRKSARWRCKCDCGREYIVRGHSLRNGHTTSCGCAIIEASTKHGMHGTRLYNIYRHMIQRCHNETDKAYKDYGARGIYVCDEWRGENGFINFMNWAFANGYTDELSIDRKDNDGPYSPENCRWVTMAVQANNRRNTIYITYNGEMHSISEWAIIYNIPYATLYDRYVNKHWTAEQALITPVSNNIHLVSNSFGETHTIEEWSRITGINYKTLYNRVFIDRLSIDQAISIPVNPIAVPKYITYEGTKMCYSDWERARGFSSGVISYRMKQGMTDNEALNTPVKDNKGNDKPINAIYFVNDNGKPI